MVFDGSDSSVIGTLVLIASIGGLLAGMIAYSRVGGAGTFIGFFIFGALFPLVGIIVACFVKPKQGPPQPPGWYPDPWSQYEWRWWDGYQWSWHGA